MVLEKHDRPIFTKGTRSKSFYLSLFFIFLFLFFNIIIN